jgi:hypothetical protein
MDCLFAGQCSKVSTVYVSASGVDNFVCGLSAETSCRNVDYVFSTRLETSGTIYITSGGDYGVRCRGPATYQVAFEAPNVAADAEEGDYPGMYPSNNGLVWLNTSNSGQQLTIKNFRLFFPTSGFTGYLFRTKVVHSSNVISNCFIYHNSTSSDLKVPRVLYGDSGVMIFINVVVHDLIFNGVGFLKMDYPGSQCTYSFINCSFRALLQKGQNPVAFNFGTTAGYYQVENTSFVNLTQSIRGPMGGVLDWPLDASMTKLSDVYFSKIVVRQHAVRFNSVKSSCTIRNLVFDNVTSWETVGGAIYIIGNAPSKIISFVDSMFTLCVTKMEKGGFV